ncbi:MAG: signal recognition particle-docking protein FtsY [Clostridia bacterium]|nr:signal recognition particle-docking protein FtsY [Clostridia bacterium]
MDIFAKIKAGLTKTRDSIAGRIDLILNSFTKIDEDLMEELCDALILSDMGAETADALVDELRDRIKEKGIKDADALRDELRGMIADRLCDGVHEIPDGDAPLVILLVGVNGAGKTTTAGKLAGLYAAGGKKVLLCAADTFRAAAADQLEIWAGRAGAGIVRHGEGGDPAAVVYDACSATKARGVDVLICDTAGRLHNKQNLMNELEKIKRVIDRELPDARKEVLLVLDATTGQNAVQQAKQFGAVTDVTGIVLTKLDGTAKGGIVLPIHTTMGYPVKFVCVGETIDDMLPFDAKSFAEALI